MLGRAAPCLDLPALAVQGGAGTSGLSPPGQPCGRTLRAQAGGQLALASHAQAAVRPPPDLVGRLQGDEKNEAQHAADSISAGPPSITRNSIRKSAMRIGYCIPAIF